MSGCQELGSNSLQSLSTYASYHRNPANIATHFVGIPMIFFSVVLLLSKPLAMQDAWLPITPALIAAIPSAIFYLRLDRLLGLIMVAMLVLCMKASANIVGDGSSNWVITGVVLFVVGWIFQSIGHVIEGRKPAFLDDLVGLLIGPLFIVAETGFMLGVWKKLKSDVEANLKTF
jgi:uncharacterized membrane protein YGL010W